MRIFLTGATGYIGSAVAEALQKSGHTVIGLARSDEKAKLLSSRGYQVCRGNLLEPASITKATADADATIHVAFSNDAKAAKTDESAVTAFLESLTNTQKPFIYTSGIWVMGNTGDTVANETFSLNPTPLVAWRAKTESQILEASKQGLSAVIIRPALVYGRGGGLPAMLSKSAREQGVARYIGTGKNRWTFVHVEDLAELYVLALSKTATGNVFIAAHGPSYTVHEVAEAASFGAGTNGRVEGSPVEDSHEKLRPLANALILDQQVSGEKAKKVLGWSPKAPSVLQDLKEGSYATAQRKS